MAKVGYARTSTVEQIAGIEAQVRDLLAAGCDKVFQEHVSAVKQRDKLEEALGYIREGDEFVVTKVDRLARSVGDFLKLHEEIKAKGVKLTILQLGMDMDSAIGAMVLTMLAGFAQMERSMMLERQKEGVAKAKEDGRYPGRKPLPDEIKQQVMSYLDTGVSKVWIAKRLGIGEASVYRIAKEWRRLPAK